MSNNYIITEKTTMDLTLLHFRKSLLHKAMSFFVAITFIFTLAFPPSIASAQTFASTVLNLPMPGAFVTMTDGFSPAIIRGITIDRDNALAFDFIVDRGQTRLEGDALVRESNKMIKYFLAALTTPEEDMWVNLSPYEKNRIIPENFGQTEMGRDLLAQDYMLKQLSASMVFPDDELGAKFWKRVHEKAQAQFGSTDIPMETFNKIWIVPTKAVVYEHGNSAFVVESYLKVMHETDYDALTASQGLEGSGNTEVTQSSDINTQVIKEILIPEIEKEVNNGEIFANLRQIYNSMILATWYKINLKESLLGQVYVNQSKTVGVQTQDKEINNKIYEQYVAAFKKGVYNIIKEDYNPATQEVIPKKYFSGGFGTEDLAMVVAAGTIRGRDDFSKEQTDAMADLAGSYEIQGRLVPKVVNVGVRLNELDLNSAQRLSLASIGDNTPFLAENLFEADDVISIVQASPRDNAMISEAIQNRITQSSQLRTSMEASFRERDFDALNATLEGARVDLGGRAQSNPMLFSVGSQGAKPVEINVAELSDENIQYRINKVAGKEFTLTKNEITKIRNKEALVFEEESVVAEARNKDLVEYAVKAGLLGVIHNGTNIKRMAGSSHLSFLEEIQNIVDSYNGYVVWHISLEESSKVLKGDGTGMNTLARAIRKEYGDDVLEGLNIITDGGTKSRGGLYTGHDIHNGLMLYKSGKTYIENAFLTLSQARMQIDNLGDGFVYWMASDGDYQLGNLTFGAEKQMINDVVKQDDFLWTIAGELKEIIPEGMFDTVEDVISEGISQASNGTKTIADDLSKKEEDALNLYLSADETTGPIIKNILDGKLESLGNNFGTAEGKLIDMHEKPSPAVLLQKIVRYNERFVTPNSFLNVFRFDAFNSMIDVFGETISYEGETYTLGEAIEGSFYQSTLTFQTAIDGWLAFFAGKIKDYPIQEAVQKYGEAIAKIFPISQIYVMNVNSFTDRGKQDTMHAGFTEDGINEGLEIDGLSKDASAWVERGVVSIGDNVEVDATAAQLFTKNVELTSDVPIKIKINGRVNLTNVKIDLTATARKLAEKGLDTLVIEDDSSFVGINTVRAIEIHGAQVAVFGLNDAKDIWDNSKTGWETIDAIEVYPNEVLMMGTDVEGNTSLSRTFLYNAPAKGTAWSKIVANNGGEQALSETNPRLVGTQLTQVSLYGHLVPNTLPTWFVSADRDFDGQSREDAQFNVNYALKTERRLELMEYFSDLSATQTVGFAKMTQQLQDVYDLFDQAETLNVEAKAIVESHFRTLLNSANQETKDIDVLLAQLDTLKSELAAINLNSLLDLLPSEAAIKVNVILDDVIEVKNEILTNEFVPEVSKNGLRDRFTAIEKMFLDVENQKDDGTAVIKSLNDLNHILPNLGSTSEVKALGRELIVSINSIIKSVDAVRVIDADQAMLIEVLNVEFALTQMLDAAEREGLEQLASNTKSQIKQFKINRENTVIRLDVLNNAFKILQEFVNNLKEESESIENLKQEMAAAVETLNKKNTLIKDSFDFLEAPLESISERQKFMVAEYIDNVFKSQPNMNAQRFQSEVLGLFKFHNNNVNIDTVEAIVTEYFDIYGIGATTQLVFKNRPELVAVINKAIIYDEQLNKFVVEAPLTNTEQVEVARSVAVQLNFVMNSESLKKNIDEIRAQFVELFVYTRLADMNTSDHAMMNSLLPLLNSYQETQVTEAKYGGINLNPDLLDLQIKRDDNGVPFPVMQQPLESMNIQGFLPVIMNVTPINNLPLLLGLDDDEAAEFDIGLLDAVFDRVVKFIICKA